MPLKDIKKILEEKITSPEELLAHTDSALLGLTVAIEDIERGDDTHPKSSVF